MSVHEIPQDVTYSGVRSINEEEAKQSFKLFLRYRSDRMKWYNDRVENDNFYHNEHYDEKERKDIEARGQAPLAINLTYAIVKQMISFLTSSQPEWHVVPFGDVQTHPHLKQNAYTLRELLKGTWKNSRGHRQFTQIIKDVSVIGVGYGMPVPSYRGHFGIKYKHIPYHYVYVAPNVDEIDYSDADNIIISKRLTTDQAASQLNVDRSIIEEAARNRDFRYAGDDKSDRYLRYSSPFHPEDDYVDVVQRMSLERRKLYHVVPINPTIQSPRRFIFELNDQYRQLERQGIVRIEEIERTVLAKYISVGEFGKKFYQPIDSYTLTPFINEFNNTPYPLGDVDFLYGLQRAINKFILLAILNGTLANSLKIMAPRGSINKEQWKKDYPIPGAILDYEWTRDGQPVPQEISPQPFAGEFLTLPLQLIKIMEYVTGIFGVMQGDPEGAPDTASGLISLQGYGGQKVKLLGRNISEALSDAGRIMVNIFQNYAPYNESMPVIQRGGEVDSIPYNLVRAEGSNLRIENDLSLGDYNVEVTLAPNYGSERQMKAKVLADLAAQTQSPMLIKPILQLADIPEADEIAEQIDALSQANAKVEELQQSLERMEQINRQLENQVLQKAQKVELEKFGAQLDKLVNKLDKEYSLKMRDELDRIKQDGQ